MLAAGGRQVIWLDLAFCTCTRPTDTTVIIDGCELKPFVENFLVGVIAIPNFYDVTINRNLFCVLSFDIFSIGQTSVFIFRRPSATVHVVLTDSRLGTR